MTPNTLKMLPTIFRVGFADLVAYRSEMVIWILTTTMPLIMFSMWSSIASQGPVGRFDVGTFASYFLATLIVRQLASAWIVWELNHQIRTGALSTALLRPVHPLVFHAAQNLSAVPFRMAMLLPIVALSLFAIPSITFSAHPVHWLAALWTIAAAWILTFAIQAMIGLLALYTEQSLSFQEAWFGLWAILSGYLIPLELIPQVERVAIWLPFRSMGMLPVEIALGHLDRAELLLAVAIQAAWVLLAVGVLRWAWPRAMRRFEAYGS